MWNRVSVHGAARWRLTFHTALTRLCVSFVIDTLSWNLYCISSLCLDLEKVLCIKQDTHRHAGIQFRVSLVSHSMRPLASIKLTHIVPSDHRAIFEGEICFGVQSRGALIINLNRRHAPMAVCSAISPPHNNHQSLKYIWWSVDFEMWPDIEFPDRYILFF